MASRKRSEADISEEHNRWPNKLKTGIDGTYTRQSLNCCLHALFQIGWDYDKQFSCLSKRYLYSMVGE